MHWRGLLLGVVAGVPSKHAVAAHVHRSRAGIAPAIAGAQRCRLDEGFTREKAVSSQEPRLERAI
jgi:hypothetical protein